MAQKISSAVFASGCFWCGEAIFKEVKGVVKVTPGYAGGTNANPSYEEVSTGSTGYAESIKIEFDPAVVSYNQLLDIFFNTHDPTTKDRQGSDIGSQYRSLILYSDEDQKKQAQDFIAKLEQEKKFAKPIVTEIKQLENFYSAEKYHLDYYNHHHNAPYCQLVIKPKLKKFETKFKEIIK